MGRSCSGDSGASPGGQELGTEQGDGALEAGGGLRGWHLDPVGMLQALSRCCVLSGCPPGSRHSSLFISVWLPACILLSEASRRDVCFVCVLLLQTD